MTGTTVKDIRIIGSERIGSISTTKRIGSTLVFILCGYINLELQSINATPSNEAVQREPCVILLDQGNPLVI